MGTQDSHTTRQEREWRTRHQEILEAATRLFTEHGYSGTTMQMIADEAEFSVGYLYKHFPGKSELMEHIANREVEKFDAIRREVRRECAGRPLLIIRETLVRSSRLLQRNAALASFLFQEPNAELEKANRRMKQHRKEDAETIRQAMALGELKQGDPALLAATIDGVVWGLIRVLTETGQAEKYLEIPGVVEELLIAPLLPGDNTDNRKDQEL